MPQVFTAISAAGSSVEYSVSPDDLIRAAYLPESSKLLLKDSLKIYDNIINNAVQTGILSESRNTAL
jgi:hypothetical protein